MKKSLITILVVLSGLIVWGQVKETPAPITKYEYWFDNDVSSRVSVTVSPTMLLEVSNIPVQNLSPGMHVCNFRAQDGLGVWSASKSILFFNEAQNVVAYKYWYDGQIETSVTNNITPPSNIITITNMDLSNCSSGIHTFTVQFVDNNGNWSSPYQTSFFNCGSDIVEYKYWVNEETDNIVTATLDQPVQTLSLDMIDMRRFPEGTYDMTIMLKDNNNNWSSPVSANISKGALPYAYFEYEAAETCEMATVAFINRSVDCNSYAWDFGDGHTDNSPNPVHDYYSAGSYPVSLTVTDTITGITSTFLLNVDLFNLTPVVTISGNTEIHQGESTVLTATGASTYVWSNGETTPSIEVAPEDTTTYIVIGTNAIGCTASDTITVNVSVGIDDYYLFGLYLYPNPASNFVDLKIDNPDLFNNEAVLFDLYGNKIAVFTIQDQVTTINIEQYSVGVYYIALTDKSGKNKTLKMVKCQ